MRQREVEFYLNHALTLLNLFTAKRADTNNITRFTIEPLNSIRHALTLVKATGLFNEEVETLRLSSVSNNSLDTIQITVEEYNVINPAIARLKSNIQIVLASMRVALPKADDNELVIYIKLPDIKDFDDLAVVLSQLKKAIQIPITLDEIGGNILISNFDSGSKWFEIVVKTTIAVALVGSLAWSGAVIFKKIEEGLAVEQHVKTVKLGTEFQAALVEANKKQINLLIEAEAQYIQTQYFKNPNNEDLERLKLSIKTMSELIEKGTEIQPALLAPENVSNLFPDYSKLMLIESKQKLIGNQ